MPVGAKSFADELAVAVLGVRCVGPVLPVAGGGFLAGSVRGLGIGTLNCADVSRAKAPDTISVMRTVSEHRK
jgi:hypothetical protein